MTTPFPAFRVSPLVLIAGGLALACWPVFRWWLARMTDGSDDPLGVAALATAGYFLWQRRREIQISPYGVWMALGLVLTQGVLPLPPLVRGACLVTALAGALALPKRQAGIVALLFLSLPVVASLQYFAGYPLRLITAEFSRTLLGLLGLDAERTGTLLQWRDHTVGVDAACSGVKMLWTTLFTAAALAARDGLGGKRTVLLLGLGLGLVVLLNGVRSSILFFPEAHLVNWPEWTHEGIGVGLFVMAAASLAALASRMGQGITRPVIPPPLPLPRPMVHAWGSAVVLSALLAIGHRSPDLPERSQAPVEWPSWFEGERLRPVPFCEAEARFAAGFPGQMNVFRSTSNRTVIFRRLFRASRELHSSADCLQASGYTMHPVPAWKDDEGRLWGRYEASGPGPVRRVRELITDGHGLTFQDPSSWFWPALLGQSTGPWTAITVME
jgi:hypothetical protein